jgi:hypothetical protein
MTTHITANPLETGSDELERYALEECYRRQRTGHSPSVLVIPVDSCEMVIKFARCGAGVVACDSASRKPDIERFVLTSGFRKQIEFSTGNLTALPEGSAGEPFDIIFVPFGLCGLPYAEAAKVVRQLLLKLRIGGKLFVSILGLHSELGSDYTDFDLRVEQRYAPLTPAIAERYGIEGAVCLYSERNLFMLLLEAGASVLRTMTTTHGNVKGVAVRV